MIYAKFFSFFLVGLFFAAVINKLYRMYINRKTTQEKIDQRQKEHHKALEFFNSKGKFLCERRVLDTTIGETVPIPYPVLNTAIVRSVNYDEFVELHEYVGVDYYLIDEKSRTIHSTMVTKKTFEHKIKYTILRVGEGMVALYKVNPLNKEDKLIKSFYERWKNTANLMSTN